MKFSRKGNKEWKAEETVREENNLERKKLTRMSTCIASSASYRFKLFKEKDLETLETWEALKV